MNPARTQYWRLTDESIANGYPRRISRDWDRLPSNLDAAFTWTNGKTYFFKGSKYALLFCDCSAEFFQNQEWSVATILSCFAFLQDIEMYCISLRIEILYILISMFLMSTGTGASRTKTWTTATRRRSRRASRVSPTTSTQLSSGRATKRSTSLR